jgi:ABC-type branched-subunit amino acid transport system ATPase component
VVILEAQSVSKCFGSLWAVNNVNLRVTQGTIHAIIGPNGAGKTTLFNLLTGFVPVSTGGIFFSGENITGLPPQILSKKGLSRSFQITSIFPELSVFENVRIAAQSREKRASSFVAHFQGLKGSTEKANQVLRFIGLLEKGDLVSKSLPYGEQRILDIGIALATDPAVLLLDEPMAGLPAADLEWIMSLIKEIAKNVTIVLIDHNIDLVISMSDLITVLNQGMVIAEGTPREIQENQKVQEAYLGGY